ncbi:hypothetical protein [Nocardia sp. NPDC049526]|uniref:hypothetical protein n=1 Tax=Nocardia sp. NPDC049526 TaxID=3364316 RepID=UPI0037B78502
MMSMWFQRFLKGVNGLDKDAARHILLDSGLICRWWQRVGVISNTEISLKLTADALHDHLEEYAAVAMDTPFISLTAGVRMRAAGPRGRGSNYIRSAHRTALTYATDNFKSPGYIFSGWVPVLPNPVVPLEGFAEDVRDLSSYSRFRRFHRQGEITAKIKVPMHQLECMERWECGSDRRSTRTDREINPNFVKPEGIAAVRDTI